MTTSCVSRRFDARAAHYDNWLTAFIGERELWCIHPLVPPGSAVPDYGCGTIGVDTALNIALEAMDRLKVTASSHQRAFLVEVMGRECGYLTLMAGIAGGAEAIIIPEVETDPEAVAAELRAAYEQGKPHALVVVAEGARYNATELAGGCSADGSCPTDLLVASFWTLRELKKQRR